MHHHSSRFSVIRRSAGFTLLELAIVLAIIGLLIGGILAGQSLIRTSEIQSVINDITKYRGAISQFNTQYNSLPGDLIDATKYWNSAGGTGSDATCRAAIASTQSTCNGDGNNQVAQTTEGYVAWQHLSKAGLVTGIFSGVSGTTTSIPKAKMANVGYTFNYTGTTTNGSEFDGTYGNVLYIGTGAPSTGVFLTPNDAYQLDAKIDDGKPGLGDIYTFRGTLCTNVNTAAAGATAIYAVATTTVRCMLNTKIDGAAQ